MDSAALVAVAVIVGVPAAFVAARICTEPFTGLCLWVLLLPVTKTVASLMGYPFGAGPIVLQKLTLADPVLLLTAFGAWVSASGAAGALGERQGRRIVGLLAAFCTVGILSATLGPTGSESLIELATYVWLCVSLVVIAFLSVVASGSRGGVVFAALSIWLMVMLTSPRLCLVWTCAALLAAGSAWRQYERHHDELPYGIRRAVSFLESDSHDLRDM